MKRILQNSFSKTALCLLIALMSGGSAWAAEEVYKTMRFGANYCTYSNSAVSNYTQTWNATYEGFRMDIVNFKNIGSDNVTYPTYISTGTNGTVIEASVTTNAPIDDKITKVIIQCAKKESSLINSFKLQISNNGTSWTELGDFRTTNEVIIPSDNQATGCYYRLVADCKSSNGVYNFIKLEKIDFYHEAQGLTEAPIITSDPQIFTENTSVTITCPEPDQDATIEYSTDHGYNWRPYTGAFTLTETSTILARATMVPKRTNQSSAVVTHTDDAHHFDWNLTQASYSSQSTALVTWTKEDATMTLSKGIAAANNHLGGNGNSWTEFSKAQTLTIAPNEDYIILEVVITASNADNATTGFGGLEWTNATQTINEQYITVVPTVGTEPISVTVANTTRIIGVNVYCSPASSPYVTAAEDQTVISGTSNGTIDVYYNRLSSDNATIVLCDADWNPVSYDWFEVELNGDKDVTFTVTEQNPNTTATRAAYFYVDVNIGVDDYRTGLITVTQDAPIPVAISAVGYATLYYGKKNLIVPEDVTAATYKVVEGKLKQSSTYSTIPAGSGVVLSGDQGTYYFYESMTADAKDANNQLKGSDEPTLTSGGTYYYALTLNADSDPKSVGFYWMTEDGKPFTNGAHKAYLALDEMFAEPTTPVKSYLTFIDDEEDPTGIENLNANANEGAIYNLAGQRIQKMQKGINIVNGKKIIVK